MRYDVDTQRIEQQLAYLERCRQIFITYSRFEQPDQGLFLLSRAIHMAVECMIDVGTVMIDGFIMRDPGGYLDIVDILLDEQVIPKEVATQLQKWITMREQLIRHYVDVELAECEALGEESGWLLDFRKYVQKYLQQELITE